MSKHEHAFKPEEWPFDNPENTGAISCRHVLEDSRPTARSPWVRAAKPPADDE